jgi:heptosyltransferase-2
MPDPVGSLAVVQPLPGIGDMIWHLPHIRAIARWAGRPVTLVAKPRSAATELFSGEKTIADVIWLDRNPRQGRGSHDGFQGFARLVLALRRRAFDSVVLLHHSRMLAAAMLAAGVPQRFGYGFGSQRLYLNRPPHLDGSLVSLHPYEQARRWLAAAAIPQEEPEPSFSVTAERREAARALLGRPAGALVAIGIGSSEPCKQWGAERFAELSAALLDDGWPSLVLAGGPAEAALAKAIRGRLGDRATRVHAAIGWNLADLAGLLAESSFYVGNDTGVMNLAAAVGITTFSLFGALPPFHHSSAIVPIVPADARTDVATGMARITTQMVLEATRSRIVRPLMTPAFQRS